MTRWRNDDDDDDDDDAGEDAGEDAEVDAQDGEEENDAEQDDAEKATRSQNLERDIARASAVETQTHISVCTKICDASARPLFRDNRFVHICAIEPHIDISQTFLDIFVS